MQRADRGVRVPGAARAVLGEHLGQALRVVGEVLQRHGAVLDEGDRLAVALHGHHDVEPGLAHFPQRRLRRRRRASRPRCPAGRDRPSARPGARGRAAAPRARSPANSTSRIASGLPISARSITGRKAGLARASSIMVRSTSSTAVGFELDDVLRRCPSPCRSSGSSPRPASCAWAAAASFSVRRSRDRERAFAADQQVREVHRIVGRVGPLATAGRRCRGCSRRPGAAPWDTCARSRRARRRPSAATLSAMARTRRRHVLRPRRAEARARAVGQDGVDGGDVVHHVAVADRAAAAGIVARHAAQGALRRRRDVDRDTRGRAAAARR